MKYLKILPVLSFVLISLSLGSCEFMLDPEDDAHRTSQNLVDEPAFGEGLLMTAYLQVPTYGGATYSDPATDDAVSNNRADAFLRIGTGEWTSQANVAPVTLWANTIRGMMYANKFLTLIDEIPWKWSDEVMNKAYKRRFKGECYAVRGILKYHLLVTIGGYDEAGNLLGFPDYDHLTGSEAETDADFNRPRMSFAQSMQSIYDDLDKSLEYLPMDYGDVSNIAGIPVGFEEYLKKSANGTWDFTAYNQVFGSNTIQRVSGRISRSYKARAALLAASPAFNPNNELNLWTFAANISGVLLKEHGGIGGLDVNGHKWFTASVADAITKANDSKEIIWRRPKGVNRDAESVNYPPSIYGTGRVNPSQNLIDAFPMANGYPITDATSGYNPVSPYSGRDPRLALSIVYDGTKVNGTTINTGVGGKENAKDSVANSTRTGYYLMKTMRNDMNVRPQDNQTKNHYVYNMKYTELYLIYAEAANEAWGPDGDNGYGFTPRNVIGAIRQRAGITSSAFINSLNNKEDMRELIRNERRLELSFEGFRFWDVRRWLLDLNGTIYGVNINRNRSVYSIVPVEERVFNNSYMHYGPIPYNETLKYDQLVQNKGWK